jgi:hypothetical protein
MPGIIRMLFCRPVFCLTALLAGCSATHGTSTPVGPGAPPRPPGCLVDVYPVPPDRPYVVVSHLTVNIEKTHFLASRLEEAMPELRAQACRSGADGIIGITERTDSYLESRSYTVSAQGIRFTR